MTITARYPATCPSCSQPIAIGASVEWSKGAKARHTSCSTSAPAAATPRTSSARSGSYLYCLHYADQGAQGRAERIKLARRLSGRRMP